MSAIHSIPVGATGQQSVVVTRDITIASLDDRLPSVFATPAMINFMEITAAQAIEPYLPDGWLSVGVVVNVRHLAATPEGATVRVTATVTEVGDKRVTFAVEAHDEVEKIGEGTHVRALVERSRFLRAVQQKARSV
jgi:predicted thioesterase